MEIAPTSVVFALPERGQRHGQAEMLYTCPRCLSAAWQQVPRPLAVALVEQGAAALPLAVTDEVQPQPYPENRGEGPALSPDDLLTLHELLQTPDWAARLADVDQRRPGTERGT